MARHLIENTLSLLGGAGLGAALMYLFDPELGGDRRQDMKTAAGQAVSSTGAALRSTAQAAGDSARSLAGRISDYAHGRADDASSRASSIVSDLADRARDKRDDLVDRASALWGRTRRSIAGQESPRPAATAGRITVGAVSLLAMGAAAMYFFDPARGRGRRAWARDKAFSTTRRAGRQARGLGRHLGNKMQGVAHHASQMMPESWSGGGGGEQPSQPMMSGTDTSMRSASPEVGRT
jgi:hypothetical protein